jgi:hypothetical protein
MPMNNNGIESKMNMIAIIIKHIIAMTIKKGRDARMCASIAILANTVFTAKGLDLVPE